MKLYRVDFHDAAKGLTHTWHSNRAKAQVTLLQLQREARSRGVACLGTEAVEVSWSNEFAHSDGWKSVGQ